MKPLTLFGLILFKPDIYAQNMKEKKSFTVRGVLPIILFIFMFYLVLFGYQDKIIHMNGGFADFVNIIAKALIGFIFFVLWYFIDWIWSKIFLKSSPEDKETIKQMLSVSFIPLIFLLGLWTFIRLLYMDSYYASSLMWIPIITIGITLTWHYLLVFYFESAFLVGNPRGKMSMFTKILILILWVASVIGLILFAFFGVPPLVGYTSEDLFVRMF